MTPDYTFDDVRAHHDQFTLRDWIEHGEIMRYAFLRTYEFMPHALIHRDGPIATLAERRATICRHAPCVRRWATLRWTSTCSAGR